MARDILNFEGLASRFDERMRFPRRSCAAGAALVVLMVPFSALLSCQSYDASLLHAVDDVKDEDAGRAQPGCGNGMIDAEESCDTAIPSGQEGACPAQCTSEDDCVQMAMAGEDCQAQCVSIPITAALSGDGCCPPGAGAIDDSDCGFCGDEIVGPGETCDPPGICPTREECSHTSACIFGTYAGDPDRCTAVCRGGLSSECENGDGCCPVGCDSQDDDDCSTSCGNGLVEPQAGETCEPGDPFAPCAESCDDGVACTSDLTSGSVENCNVECANVAIEMQIDGDGCCPPVANATNDSDCAPVCGNEVAEGSEICDPCPSSCDDAEPCTTDSRAGSASNCNVVCSHTPVTQLVNGDSCCPSQGTSLTDSDCSPACGNHVTESGEDCDGEGYCNQSCDRVLPTSIVHRYRFTGSGTTVTDSIGSANGTVVGDTLDNNDSSGKVTLAGGTSGGYVDLPNGIISPLGNATFEAWVTWTNTSTDHVRVFDFGSSTSGEGQQGTASSGYLYLTGGHDSSRHPRVSFSRDGSNTVLVSSTSTQFPTSGVNHIAAVFNDSGDQLLLYLNGALLASGALGSSDHLSALTDNNNWLGRSQFAEDDEFAGSFHEFRIYNQALSASEIMTSFQKGSDPP
jgi:hypothetical protein